MATPAVIGGIGAGINAVTGIGSSMHSKREGKKASQRLENQQNAMMDLLLGAEVEGGGRAGGLLGDLTSGAFGAVDGLQDRVLSGGQELNRLAGQLEGINPQYNFNEFQFGDAPTTGGFEFQQSPDIGDAQFGRYDFNPLNTGSSYDFTQGSNLMDQTMDAFRTQEAGVRANALDQMARQSAADMSGLDAALAGRGLARGSGVATGALADLAGQQGAQMSALERDLATLGSQTALQGAQFDVNRALQEQQMQSGYNLGERQFLTGAQQQQQAMESQYGLSRDQALNQAVLGRDQLRSQNWATDQSLRSQYGLAQDQLASQNWLADQQMRSQYDLGFQDMASRYGLSQAELQQRGLGMAGDLISTGIGHDTQASLGIGNMYAGMLSPVLSSLLGMQEIGGRNVAAAGQGAGAGMAGIGSGLMDLATSGLLNKD